MKKILSFTLLFLLLVFQYAQGQVCDMRILDPRVALFLKMIGYQDLTIEQLRNTPIAKLRSAGPPALPYPKGDITRIKITADSIPVLVFNPLHGTDLPIIINYHGGGFIAPLVPSLEHSLWLDAKNYAAIVFAVDYRVAPENKFPAAVNDCYNSFKWILGHGREYGGDPARLVLMGNSAGANLVAVVAQKANKEGFAGKIKLQVMNGLPVDMRPSNMENAVSYQQNAVGYFQTKAACYFSVESYAPGKTDDTEVSPILAKDLRGLPPAVIINAEFDPLRDDGILYADRLRKAGVKVWDKCFAGQIHMLLGLPSNSNEIKEMEQMVRNAMVESF
jgi:acetyl esterase